MLWLCSPWSRNSSETSLTLIRRSSKALPLKRQEEQSFCTGSRKKKCFLYVLSPDCFLCIVVTNLMKITYLNYETKRKTPDSFYVHSYLLYGQLIFKNKKQSLASMKDQLIFFNFLLIKYLFIYLYIIFYTLIRLEAFFKYFKENMQCVSLKYLLLAINHIVKFVEMTACQHYQWPYCSHHAQLNYSP